MNYECIVIGSSAGGMNALQEILNCLKKDFSIPIVIVQHLHPESDDFMVRFLNQICPLQIKEAEVREKVYAGKIYFAPPNYHLLFESDKTFSFTVDEKVNYCRPSIDVTFQSASDVFGSNLIGVILTGANNDGALGLQEIKKNGGLTIVQEPSTAEVDTMPKSAIRLTEVDCILPLENIGPFLMETAKQN